MKRRRNARTPRRSHGPTPAPAVVSIAKHRYVSLIILAVLCLFIAVLRVHTYNEPFERDITSHAVIAHELLAGRSLYSDLWDSKPPAIFVTYALGDLLAGYGPRQVYFIGVAVAIITLLGCYRAGSALGGVPGGLWTAAFWAVICNDLWLWANQPNIEVGMNACLVWAFALMIRADRKKLQWGRWLAIGGLFALASVYKQVAVIFAAFLSLLHLLTCLGDRQTRKLAFLQVCIIAAAGAAVWAGVFAFFALTGRFATFYDTIFTYGRWYAKSRGGNLLANIIEGFRYKRLFPMHMKSTPVLIIFAVVGIIVGLWKGSRRNWLLLLGFALAAPFAIAITGRFYGHYYQLWLVPLVVGAGWAVSATGPKGHPTAALVRSAVGVVGLIVLLCFVLPQHKLSADEWSATKIGPQFVVSRSVVKEVDALLEPGETLYVWGQNPEFYFWSGRRPPTGLIWSTDLMDDNPLAQKHTARALEDLKRELPEIFVVNQLQFKVPLDHPVIRWALVEKRYVPLPGNPDRGVLYGRPFFRIFVRRDGRLAARLGA